MAIKGLAVKRERNGGVFARNISLYLNMLICSDSGLGRSLFGIGYRIRGKFAKHCAGLCVDGAGAKRQVRQRFVVLFYLCPGSGEGRENRPQLRCGNVSIQTHTLRTNAGAKPIGVASGEGEGRGSRGISILCGHIRSPNIPSGHTHASTAKLCGRLIAKSSSQNEA
jgi:hypothetical protein